MIESSSAAEILSALGLAVFDRNIEGKFAIVGKLPAWSRRFRLAKNVELSREDLIGKFPLLDTFLADAEGVWRTGQGLPLDSGPWTQSDSSGEACTLQAVAILASKHPFLLLRLPGPEFEHQKTIIQRARDQSIEYGLMERHMRDLAARNSEVERLGRLKGEFLASMSHELRTPLNAIIGFSTLLGQERAGGLNNKQKSFVDEIGQAASHLLSVINDILDISRVEAGRLELQPEAFTLGGELTEVLSDTAPAGSREGHSNPCGGCGSGSSCIRRPCPVQASPVQLAEQRDQIHSKGRHESRFRPVTQARRSRYLLPTTVRAFPSMNRIGYSKGFSRARAPASWKGLGWGWQSPSVSSNSTGGESTCKAPQASGSRFCFTLPSGIS